MVSLAPYKFGTRSGVQTFSIATNFCVSSRRSIFQKGLLYCFSLLLHRSHTNYVNQLLFYRLVKFSTRYSTAVLIKTLVHSYYKNISVQNNKRGMGAMGKLSSHKHTPKNDDDVDDASDKYGPPSQIALGMRAGFSFRGESSPTRQILYEFFWGRGQKKACLGNSYGLLSFLKQF